ncbi:MAG TPA: carboxypeptidase-like regulatory domain-containing protein [Vicinamibacterales bacterium]
MILVRAGELVTNLRLSLPRGGVITGIVRDVNGDPASRIDVAALAAVSTHGEDSPRPATVATTDDRGVYRIFGLAPGDYVVAARTTVSVFGSVRLRSDAEIDRILRALAQRANPALTGGAGAGQPMGMSEGRDEPGASIAVTFYPGTADASGATVLHVEAGNEHPLGDFQLQFVPTAPVSGVVSSDEAVSLPALQARLDPDGPRLGWGSFAVGPATTPIAPVDREGRFTFRAVQPGSYTITVLALPNLKDPDGKSVSVWARTTVTVSGRALTGVNLKLQPALRFSGRVVLEGSPDRLAPALSRFQVLLTPERTLAPARTSFRPPVVNATADGRFEIGGLLPGRYWVSLVAPTNAPWFLQTVAAGQQEVADWQVELATADLEGAVLTATPEPSSVSGVLYSSTGVPATAYVVVIYPVDRTQWRPGSPRLRMSRPASDGRFTFDHLPEGTYFLSVLDDLGPDEWRRPDTLSGMEPGAITLTVHKGERTVQDLQIARNPTSLGNFQEKER